MEPFIVPIVSTAHAAALGRLKRVAFAGSQLSIHALPSDKPEEMQQWYTTREIKSVRDPNARTFALVKQVNGESGEKGDGDPAYWITLNGDNEKKYVMLAYSRWENLLPPETKHVEEDTIRGPAFENAERDDVLVNPNLLPEGTNEALNAAFREVKPKKREEHLNKETDCLLDVLCTDPEQERRGYGRRLLEHGLELADAAGKSAFLEATPKGVPLYERLGWRTVDMAEFTLADYGCEGEGDGEGKLKFYLMRREVGGK